MNFRYEKEKIKNGFHYIIGCDEVGRGCLAGPVVAAAVALRPEFFNLQSSISNLRDVKDSKLLTAGKREELSEIIKKYFLWSIAEVSSEEVDDINIHNASLLAMKKAIKNLTSVYSHELAHGDGLVGVDGKFKVPDLGLEQEAIIGGDNKVISIAAASIIAKVYRDALMQKFGKQYPKYNLAKHKGYATLEHRLAIKKLGITPLHRLTFCGQYL